MTTAMTTDRPLKKSESEETRTRILNTALALFREHGFEQTTMRQIAAESGMALGAAYYYFPSKEALVMAFYERAQEELRPLLAEARGAKSLEHRLSALLEIKFRYFQPNRSLLGALSHHIDPSHPLSPFSDETKPARDRDIEFFVQVLEGSKVRVPSDLKPHLPRLLWFYQMGLFLFWVYDRSEEQVRTRRLVEKSLAIVVQLIKLSSFPLLRPLRKRLVDLLLAVSGETSLSSARGKT
jgi:AcrR family transcriptional regulator